MADPQYTPVRLCTAPGCQKPAYAESRYCCMHRGRLAVHGSLDLPARPTDEERFWSKVDKTGPCWLWLAGKDRSGYGAFRYQGRQIGAHRFAYERLVGPIPEGTELDHVKARGCTNRHCVNPDHLEPVTSRVNTLRGDGPSAVAARQTECAHGHPFTPENTRFSRKPNGRMMRYCVTCRRERKQLAREKKANDSAANPVSKEG